MKADIKAISMLFSLTLIVNSLYAQVQDNRRWHIAFTGGLALPVGAFRQTATEDGIAYKGDNSVLNGFDKQGNSYAQNGYAVGMALRYSLHSHWQVTANTGYSFNSVDTRVMREFLDDFANENWTTNPPAGGYRFHVDHQDYQVIYFLPGAAYQFVHQRWQFLINPQLGLASIRYPDYGIVFLWSNDNIAFQHNGNTPSSQALMAGGFVEAGYEFYSRFNIGLRVGYLFSDFYYDISLKSPGEAFPLDKSDVVTYRQIQAGLLIGYSF